MWTIRTTTVDNSPPPERVDSCTSQANHSGSAFVAYSPEPRKDDPLMMGFRHYLMAFAVFAALCCYQIPASAVTQDITLTATVPGACTVSGSATPTAATQNLMRPGASRPAR